MSRCMIRKYYIGLKCSDKKFSHMYRINGIILYALVICVQLLTFSMNFVSTTLRLL